MLRHLFTGFVVNFFAKFLNYETGYAKLLLAGILLDWYRKRNELNRQKK